MLRLKKVRNRQRHRVQLGDGEAGGDGALDEAERGGCVAEATGEGEGHTPFVASAGTEGQRRPKGGTRRESITTKPLVDVRARKRKTEMVAASKRRTAAAAAAAAGGGAGSPSPSSKRPKRG